MIKKVGIIIQARYSSSRLPGKIFKRINGKPMLLYTVESLRCIPKSYPLIIATSYENSDKATVDFCKNYDLLYYAGSLNNVIERFINAAESYDIDHIVRVCGDSPLIDHRIVQHAINTYERFSCDLITNTFPRTYPKGQSIEIFSKNLLINISHQKLAVDDFEHITSFVYKNHEKYKIFNFTNHVDYSNYQLSVDSAEDFDKISKLINELDRQPYLYGWEHLLNLLQKD